MIETYPLTWKSEKPRTLANKRKRSQFTVNFAKSRDELLTELSRMGASNIIISSNAPTRRDGLPYANFSEPDDPGVAVYFRVFNQEYSLTCDRWDRVKDNLRAIGKHIEALRGIERWGVSSVEEIFAPYLLPESITISQAAILESDFKLLSSTS